MYFWRIVIAVFAAVFLIWFILPLFFGIKSLGSVIGSLICLLLIFRFGFAGVYETVKVRLCAHTAGTIMLRIIQIGATAFLIYAVIVSGLMIYAMHVKPVNNSTAVVLGAQVKPWGPSVLLRQRIEAAHRYLADHSASDAVLTGGKGDDEIMSEAQCMYEELVNAGISPKRVYIEDQATNTEQNIRNSLEIIKQNGLSENIAVVTDSYHQLRARIIAAKTDRFVKVSAVNTQNTLIGLSAYPAYFVREWIAIPVEILK
ncbi:MAG: YdcF family protein [Ruminococcus sp.]|nr:YdcF family protein [Ruminococcus sp.]